MKNAPQRSRAWVRAVAAVYGLQPADTGDTTGDDTAGDRVECDGE